MRIVEGLMACIIIIALAYGLIEVLHDEGTPLYFKYLCGAGFVTAFYVIDLNFNGIRERKW